MTNLIRFSPAFHRNLTAAPFNHFDRTLDRLAESLFAGTDGATQLRADVAETDTTYIIRVDVPGVAKDGINVSVENKIVRIETTVAAAVVEGEKALSAERQTGNASRAFRFATELDADAAHATHDAGVLTLTLPKKASAALKRIAIN